jgi:inhibitor of KinA
VDAARIPGVTETQAALRSVFVSVDPVAVSPAAVRAALERVAREAPADAGDEPAGRAHRLPLCVCGACALDRTFAEERLGLPWSEIVRRFAAGPYEVWAVGFLPGFPYLGPVPPGLALPRLDRPRVRVPAGSAGIGGPHAGVYPSEAPGGWRILGRTPVRLFDPGRREPALLSAGDRVVFEPFEDHAAFG